MSIFLFSLVMLGSIGCATESGNSTITPTSIAEVVTVTPTVVTEEEDKVTAKKETNTNDRTPTPVKSSAVFSANKDTKENETTKVTITKTNGLCEVLEKVDASQQATYNSFNRMLSNDIDKGAMMGNSLFCIDDSTGVIYFVNQAKDHFLYRIKDGEVMLAVAMPVKEIYPYEGSVYFMLESYDKYELKEMHSGDIYCYTPENGNVELVYPVGVVENSENHRLLVKEDGIYFAYGIDEGIGMAMSFYHLPFGATEPVKDKNYTVEKGWKNYSFSLMPEFVLESRTIGEDGTREVLPISAKNYLFCVVEDVLYFADSGTVCALNLETKEEVVYNFFGKGAIITFVMTETDIWMSPGLVLYRIDLNSKEVSSYKLSDGDEQFYYIDTLYTDGKQLYVTCSKSQTAKLGKDFSLARILTENVEVINNQDSIMRIDFLTE